MDNTEQSSLTAISIGPGIRGIERGVSRVVRLREIAFVEREAFVIENLVAEMEASLLAPSLIWSDAKTFIEWAQFFQGIIDILFAGYPCQPFSNAGNRKGTEDPRHLYPYIERTIDIIRPKIVFLENVRGHVTLGLREVIGSLEGMGYRVHWGIFSAEETGASHKRERVFIMAIRKECLVQSREQRCNDEQEGYNQVGINQERNLEIPAGGRNPEQCGLIEPSESGVELADSNHNGERTRPRETEGERETIEGEEQWQERNEIFGKRMRPESGYCCIKQMGNATESRFPLTRLRRFWELQTEEREGLHDRFEQPSKSILGNINNTRLQGRLSEVCGECTYEWLTRANGPFGHRRVSRPGQPQQTWEHPRVISRKTESAVGLSTHGYHFREDILRALGNSVYADTAELAFRTLLKKHGIVMPHEQK